MSTAATSSQARAAARSAVPWTLWVGLVIILASEVLLAIDVVRRGGLLVPYDAFRADLPEPTGTVGHLARWVAINMTALCWIGYLFVADGLLTWLARRRSQGEITSIRARPNRFLIAWLTSIPVWCFFDAINFYFMDAWRYHGLPGVFSQRLLGYFVAFAAISPGMFLAAQLYQHLGLRQVRVDEATLDPRRPAVRRGAWALVLGPALILTAAVLVLLGLRDDWIMLGIAAALLLLPMTIMGLWTRCPFMTSFSIGAGFLVWTFVVLDPIANLTLWVGLIYLLDPLAARLRQPSLLRDWLGGRYGRTLALFAGGATCGLLWEFWNYWAIAKWTYHLPFLGTLDQVRYFEMPVVGFLGFLPFAAECWVMLNVIIGMMERGGLRIAEPLPDADAVM